MPKVNSSTKGDLLVDIQIVVPETLTNEEKDFRINSNKTVSLKL